MLAKDGGVTKGLKKWGTGLRMALTSTAARRKWCRWVLGAAILTACILLLDFGAVLRMLGRIPIHWLLFILLLMTLDRLLMAWKWSLLLWSLQINVSFLKVVRFYYQGTFTGIFLPSGLGGDLLRTYWVSRTAGATHRVYASLLMEKVIGLLSAVNWALVGIIVFASMQLHAAAAEWTVAAVVSTLSLNALFLLSLSPSGQTWMRRVLGVALRSRPFHYFRPVYQAYANYREHCKTLAQYGVLTVVEHGLQMLVMLAMAESLGIHVEATLFLAVTAVHLLIYRLPLSPDGWGVGEVTAIGLYGLIGIPPEGGFALAFLAHLMQTIVVLPGLWFLWRSPSMAYQ